MKTVRTPVAELGYEEWGQPGKPAVILVHGFPDDATTWKGVVAALTAQPLWLLAPYARGFGPSRVHDTEAAGAQVAALARDVLEFADALGLGCFLLVGHDWGARAAHGAAVLSPGRPSGLVTLASAYGSGSVTRDIELRQARAFWYQWLFHSAHGRALLESDRRAFCRYLWRVWSPRWDFTAAEFDAVAPSFDNPQFVETVIHYYRHRWGGAPGSPRYKADQAILDELPPVPVPTIFACGLADACNLPEFSRGNDHLYSASYRRVELTGVGHFIQRERPEIVAALIRDQLAQG